MASPEESSQVLLLNVQQTLFTKDQTIRDLQQYIGQHQLFRNNWHSTTDLPQEQHDMRRSSDGVTDDTGDNIYLRRGDTTPSLICKYCVSSGDLVTVGQSKYYRCSMAFYGKQIILIGGACGREDKAERTADIYCVLLREGLPFSLLTQMPTRRSRTTALTFSTPEINVLIVIGGEDEDDSTLRTVEIMDWSDQKWYRGLDIPEPLCCSSGSIANGYIYLLGGWTRRNTHSSAVFRCNVYSLLATCQPIELAQQNPLFQINACAQFQNPSQSKWEALPDLPVFEATCTTVNNTLVVVGGLANNVAVHDIRTFNEEAKRWEVIEYLSHARYICFAVGLPDKLIIIGGKKDSTSKENTIEILQ